MSFKLPLGKDTVDLGVGNHFKYYLGRRKNENGAFGVHATKRRAHIAFELG